MNYILFHKASDYQRGQKSNLCYTGGRLRLEDGRSEEPGVFLSGTLDAGEKETVWHRLVVDAAVGDNMAVWLYLYATDSEMEAARLEEEWQESQNTVRQQMEQMKKLERLAVRNPSDVLLHGVKGRFLWMGILMWGNGEAGPEIGTIQIYLPKETWNTYLPEIYQGEKQEFLERFLGIFQSLYHDMEEKILHDAAYLDIQAVDEEMLVWLSGWLHVENSHLWTGRHLKQYLEKGAALFSIRGTARALIRMVEIYTGETCFLVETGGGLLPGRVLLMMREEAIPDVKTYRAVERILREGKPADVDVRLVPLKPYLFLDQDTYLGINSVLNEYGQAVLDQEAALSLVMLGNGEVRR